MTEPSAQRVAGKRAFVTGAAGGLGAAIARMLARHGANVFLTDIDEAGVRAVADEINHERGRQANLFAGLLRFSLFDPAQQDFDCLISHIVGGLHDRGYAGTKEIFCCHLIEGNEGEVLRRAQSNGVQTSQRCQPGDAVRRKQCGGSFLKLEQAVLAYAGNMLLFEAAIPDQ